MSEWKEYKLGDVALKMTSGGTPKTSESSYYNGGIPWLNTKEVNFNRILKTEKNISELGLSNSSAKWIPKYSVIVAMYGATAGKVAYSLIDLTTNQACCNIIIDKKKADSLFVYYYLQSSYVELENLACGAAQQNLSVGVISDFSVLLPSLAQQKLIAGVLSSLDDKIDLLNRQNQTLESMAEALFRHYFIDNHQPEWKEKSLFDCIELIGGGTPKTTIDEYWNGPIKWLSGGDIANNHKGFIFDAEKSISEIGLSNSSTRLLPKYATVISARGTVGKFCILSEPMAFSQSNYGILPQYKDCFFFTYLLVSYSVEELQSAAYGSVFDTITTNTFKGLSVSLPPKELILQFETMITVYFSKIYNNQSQIITLCSLRDTLLPKIMNKEIEIECNQLK
ncbi:hypothetical protein SDC9_49673 [bioreactor metagenome]|uniref:Type I restriction modification DNA specificity domain-containing protein n=1 Tax=bioreactor metagenome TaxID=1076179 RepID=A0A644WHR0_9ZZZZ